ncbi:VanZ family protein [Comamonadaceae bacterium G21597-S1]|nr:VanZ family protein [Comamonadaceae bacterium G21597-S1]
MIKAFLPIPLRAWRLALAGALVVVTMLSLLPLGPDAPSTGWDKTDHLLGFGLLAILACQSWPRRNLTALAGLLVYGALIEVLQSFTPYRFAEWNDLLADAMGLLLGWSLLLSARTLWARR